MTFVREARQRIFETHAHLRHVADSVASAVIRNYSSANSNEACSSGTLDCSNPNVLCETVPAVTMSFTPAGKRRRAVDSFGYGLPEIVAPKDVTVPLLVGDQQVSILIRHFNFYCFT